MIATGPTTWWRELPSTAYTIVGAKAEYMPYTYCSPAMFAYDMDCGMTITPTVRPAATSALMIAQLSAGTQRRIEQCVFALAHASATFSSRGSATAAATRSRASLKAFWSVSSLLSLSRSTIAQDCSRGRCCTSTGACVGVTTQRLRVCVLPCEEICTSAK